MSKYTGATINLTDTVDSYARKIHVNVRNNKVTCVQRWKDRSSEKAHTQRFTLSNEQVTDLIAALIDAHYVAEPPADLYGELPF